jgi:hypothetical protein
MSTAGLAVPKPAKPIRCRIDDVEAGPEHSKDGHGQASPDVVPVGPKVSVHGQAGCSSVVLTAT